MKRIKLLACALFTVMTLSAQDYAKHNLQVNIGGGMSTMLHSPQNGSYKMGFGGTAEVQYQYMFSEHWGAGIGIGIDCLNSSTKYNMLVESVEGQPLEEIRIKEKQHMLALTAPVQAIYRTMFNDRWGLQAALGVSVMYPVIMKYNADITTMSGPCGKEKGDMDHNKINVGAVADVGATYSLNDKLSLYLGLYAKGMALSATSKSDAPLIDGTTYTNTFNSNQVSKVLPLEAGLKIGLRIGFGNNGYTSKRKGYSDEDEMNEIRKALKEEEERNRVVAQAARERVAAFHNSLAAQRSISDRLHSDSGTDNEGVNNAELVAASETDRKKIDNLNTVAATFNHASANPHFKDDTDLLIDSLKTYLEQHPKKRIYLTGHTDNSGKPVTNKELSQRRAEACKEVLVSNGIDVKRIVTSGKGATRPIASNTTPEGRAQNRRVEIRVK